jgi:rubrerythrin
MRISDDSNPDDAQDERPENSPSADEEPTCAVCGHVIAQDDLICPNCGVSLAAG